MPKQNEERKCLRHECPVPVEGREDSAFAETRVIDIGHGGIGLISSRTVTIGEEIALEIELTEGEQPVLVMGQVQWVKKGKDCCRFGIKFTKNLLADSKNRLRDYFPR